MNDHFEYVKELGRGAFGVATLVRQRTAGRREVLRVVKEVFLESMTASARNEVHKEVGILRQLSHQHIVAYIDTFSTDAALYIVMEYADGGDLAGEVQRRREEEDPIPDSNAMMMFGQCMTALRYVHSKNIMHRDLKCQNIFRMQSGSVKLGDFGIAKVLEHTAAVAGTVIGTPAYLAPEVCENQPYTGKVDIWAMGIVLYELLALQQPFAGNNMIVLVLKIVQSEVPPLPDRVGEDVKEVVRKVLQKAPEDRPSAEAILSMPVVYCALGVTDICDYGTATGMDQFEELEVLGRGAYGVATLCKQRAVGAHAQLRVVKKVELTGVPSGVKKSALEEVRVLRRLSHPNIIAYYDYFEEEHTLHIVLEYADGGDLASSVSKHREENRQYEESEIIYVGGQILKALQYIHAKAIVHRDMKGQNVFMMKSGDVKLGDFGISKVMEHTASEMGTAIGTPSYLAPEMCENKPYGTKVDMWSLGVILYEMISLKLPFQATNPFGMMMKIVRSDPPPLPPRVSEELRNVTMRLMAKSAEDRPDANELLKLPMVVRAVGSSESVEEPAKARLEAIGEVTEVPFDSVDYSTSGTLMRPDFTTTGGSMFTMTPMQMDEGLSCAANALVDALHEAEPPPAAATLMVGSSRLGQSRSRQEFDPNETDDWAGAEVPVDTTMVSPAATMMAPVDDATIDPGAFHASQIVARSGTGGTNVSNISEGSSGSRGGTAAPDPHAARTLRGTLPQPDDARPLSGTSQQDPRAGAGQETSIARSKDNNMAFQLSQQQDAELQEELAQIRKRRSEEASRLQAPHRGSRPGTNALHRSGSRSGTGCSSGGRRGTAGNPCNAQADTGTHRATKSAEGFFQGTETSGLADTRRRQQPREPPPEALSLQRHQSPSSYAFDPQMPPPPDAAPPVPTTLRRRVSPHRAQHDDRADLQSPPVRHNSSLSKYPNREATSHGRLAAGSDADRVADAVASPEPGSLGRQAPPEPGSLGRQVSPFRGVGTVSEPVVVREPSVGGGRMTPQERAKLNREKAIEEERRKLAEYAGQAAAESRDYRMRRRNQEWGHVNILDHGAGSFEAAHFGNSRASNWHGDDGDSDSGTYPVNRQPTRSRPDSGHGDFTDSRGRRR